MAQGLRPGQGGVHSKRLYEPAAAAISNIMCMCQTVCGPNGGLYWLLLLLPLPLQAYHGGAAPCPRSSCAAAVCGDVLLVHGGQTPAGVLQDMHILNLSTLTWLQVRSGSALCVCGGGGEAGRQGGGGGEQG